MAYLPTPRDGALPAIPSVPSCKVCGQPGLYEDSPHEFADGLTDRLICAICGAHHLGQD